MGTPCWLPLKEKSARTSEQNSLTVALVPRAMLSALLEPASIDMKRVWSTASSCTGSLRRRVAKLT